MGVRQEVERRRAVGARGQHQRRRSRRRRRRRRRQRHGVAAVAAAPADAQQRPLVPRHAVEQRIGRHRELGRQVLAGEIIRATASGTSSSVATRATVAGGLGRVALEQGDQRLAGRAPAAARRDEAARRLRDALLERRRARRRPARRGRSERRMPPRICSRAACSGRPSARGAAATAPGRCGPPAPAGRATRVQPPASGRLQKLPRAAAEPAEQRAPSRAQAVVERRPAREERPQRQPRAHRARRQLALELALAPVPHHLRQRDLHRADALAAAAEGRGVGQVPRVLDADQRRRQHRAHRAGIDPAIGVAADRARRPGSGSCRRRSGCSAACPGTRCRAARCGRCRAARRGTRSGPSRSPARRGPVEKVV